MYKGCKDKNCTRVHYYGGQHDPETRTPCEVRAAVNAAAHDRWEDERDRVRRVEYENRRDRKS